MLSTVFCSMKTSRDIPREHGGALDAAAEAEAGMAEKSREFAAAGNRVYLPIAD
ncbi:hypothetical protein AB0F42_01450 [Streptomyces buecherae]|uniref:hypothetical protein n=1 Tax=Streptomyces buecherae TaxID=2763006 RepID=UPI0033D0B71B